MDVDWLNQQPKADIDVIAKIHCLSEWQNTHMRITKALNAATWRYAVGEVLLIIVGVSIALAATSWYENRDNNKQKRRKISCGNLDAGTPTRVSPAENASSHTARVSRSHPTAKCLGGDSRPTAAR
jgi:hypothetical protein